MRINPPERQIPAGGWLLIAAICTALAWMGTAHGGAFQDAQAFGQAQMGKARSTARANPTSNSVPGFTTANPPQTSMSGNAAALSNAGSTAASTDPTGAGSFVQQSAATRAQFNITAQDPLGRNAQSIQKNAPALVGMNPSTSSACRNVTTTTPDTYGTFTCSTGQTSDVFSSHVCTDGRTPDVFSDHACTSGRTPDIFRNFTCAKSRATVSSSCDRVLSVTATSRPYCYIGQLLASTSVYGITVPHQYACWRGHVTFSAICNAPGAALRIAVSGADPGGNCDSFKWYRNLGHFTAYAQPWATGWRPIGSIYYVGWSGYFYCFAAPSIDMQSLGCTGDNCAVKFRVNMGTTHTSCSDGGPGVSYRYRYGRSWRTGYCCGTSPWWGSCMPRCAQWGYGWHRQGRWWRYGRYCTQPVRSVQVPDYRHATLSFTRNHNVVTFRDQWVNQACR